ncbi:hypothetical protein ONZ45_g13941 [Pleurotus djamor]|nr:hypothetical protein ONZ45_g13941 [Pleurotus djamor]
MIPTVNIQFSSLEQGQAPIGCAFFRKTLTHWVETLSKRHAQRERRVENGRGDAIETVEDGDFAEGERVVPKEGYRTISWIWAESSEEDNKALRVEWAKAWACVRRWSEEIELLREEMRRTLVSLRHQSTEWKSHAEQADANPGVSAYAYHQARTYNGIADAFEKMWKNRSGRRKPNKADNGDKDEPEDDDEAGEDDSDGDEAEKEDDGDDDDDEAEEDEGSEGDDSVIQTGKPRPPDKIKPIREVS